MQIYVRMLLCLKQDTAKGAKGAKGHILPCEVLSDGGSLSKPLAWSINAENSSPLPSKKKSFKICKS